MRYGAVGKTIIPLVEIKVFHSSVWYSITGYAILYTTKQSHLGSGRTTVPSLAAPVKDKFIKDPLPPPLFMP